MRSFEEGEHDKFKEKCLKAEARRQDPLPEGDVLGEHLKCDDVLAADRIGWQNATTPEGMMRAIGKM